MVAAASLANLQPFQPGNTAARRSSEVQRAVKELRKLTLDAVAYCKQVLHDDNAEPAHRVKVAIAIIDKAIPSKDAAGMLNFGGGAIASLHVEFTSGEEMTITAPRIDADAPAKPNGHQSPAIEDVDFSDG